MNYDFKLCSTEVDTVTHLYNYHSLRKRRKRGRRRNRRRGGGGAPGPLCSYEEKKIKVGNCWCCFNDESRRFVSKLFHAFTRLSPKKVWQHFLSCLLDVSHSSSGVALLLLLLPLHPRQVSLCHCVIFVCLCPALCFFHLSRFAVLLSPPPRT